MALEPNAHLVVRSDDDEVLYDFLRRDRDAALLEVAEMKHAKRLLEEEVSALRNSLPKAQDHAGCNVEIRQLRDRNSQLEAELENQQSNVRLASASRDRMEAELAAERRESAMYQDALDEARVALESTSAWGHETNDSLQKANAELHQQVIDLRKQRSIRNKVQSRYRWEKEVRERLSAEVHGSETATEK